MATNGNHITDRELSAVFGNVSVKYFPTPPAESKKAKHLKWSTKRFCHVDWPWTDKHWLLDEITHADFGYINDGNYILFSSATSDSQQVEFLSHFEVSLLDGGELDLNGLRKVLTNLMQVVDAAHSSGFAFAVDEMKAHLDSQPSMKEFKEHLSIERDNAYRNDF
ncbi:MULTISPECIES: hypothetical protein [Vibrio]|uniref:hypothetical protein n=1 Tax=Vibrio TaxID=662 RepID=UPI0020755584|nr:MULTISPECIES: hypothetical protein [Vibrio]USD35627.1 hypothetical protein J8Z27_22730 [Vibrio sp. SCSIO 43186]USD72751.1 hypothetical protein J4N41_22735 [Vibrio sp. SCSIO 43139]USD98956.1 hypothetical protein CTT30_23060 [Vibrio coralliilyticus]